VSGQWVRIWKLGILAVAIRTYWCNGSIVAVEPDLMGWVCMIEFLLKQ
jgi:hypothetical protein